VAASVRKVDYAAIVAARKKYQGKKVPWWWKKLFGSQEKKAPLCAALEAKDEDAAEALLDGGADPNEVDGSGWNALHWAARKGCRREKGKEEAVVGQGDVNSIDDVSELSMAAQLLDDSGGGAKEVQEFTSEDSATEEMAVAKETASVPDEEINSSPPLFQRLLARIHDVNAGDNNGWTALMHAALNNHLDVVISLMNHPGIGVNVQNRYTNYTALHTAANNHPAIVSQLLSDDNINANLKTNKGKKTPLELAIFWNYHEDHRECVKILQDYGAPDYEPPARCCGRAEMDQSLLE
jgi:hypothetical protein